MVVKVAPSTDMAIVVTVPPETITFTGTFSEFVKVKGLAVTVIGVKGP